MAASARSSGSKLVIGAVTGTLAAVGIGTIYLPFIADRDKMRGMHEEKDAPVAAMLAQEIQNFRQDRRGEADGSTQQQQQQEQQQRNAATKAPGSMWKNIRKNEEK
jgi:hypothetical protein